MKLPIINQNATQEEIIDYLIMTVKELNDTISNLTSEEIYSVDFNKTMVLGDKLATQTWVTNNFTAK